MDLTLEERAELDSIISVGYDGSLSSRAQMVLWHADGCTFAEIARRAGTTKPTASLWIGRYEQVGIGALEEPEADRKATICIRAGEIENHRYHKIEPSGGDWSHALVQSRDGKVPEAA